MESTTTYLFTEYVEHVSRPSYVCQLPYLRFALYRLLYDSMIRKVLDEKRCCHTFDRRSSISTTLR